MPCMEAHVGWGHARALCPRVPQEDLGFVYKVAAHRGAGAGGRRSGRGPGAEAPYLPTTAQGRGCPTPS